MPSWPTLFGDLKVAEFLTWVVALVLLATLIFGAVKKGLPLLKKLSDFLDDVGGEPARPGVPARPGIMARIASIEDSQEAHSSTLEKVRHEMFPNSGKSLRDQTNRIEEKLDTDNARINALTARLEEHISQSALIVQKLTKEKP